MQNVICPTGLSSATAHEGFLFIIRKLVEDSRRLVSLFPGQQTDLVQCSESAIELNLKSYWRHIVHYTDQARILGDFITMFDSQPFTCDTKRLCLATVSVENARKMAHLGHCWKSTLPVTGSFQNLLKPFLVIDKSDLNGVSESGFNHCKNRDVTEWLNANLRDFWLDLYNFSVVVAEKHLKSEWTITLSILAFIGEDINQLLLLHSIAINPHLFHCWKPPEFRSYHQPSQCSYEGMVIVEILKGSKTDFDSYLQCNLIERRNEEEEKVFTERLLQRYESEVNAQVSILESVVSARHKETLDECSMDEFSSVSSTLINLSESLAAVNDTLFMWNANRQLHRFLEGVEDCLAINLNAGLNTRELSSLTLNRIHPINQNDSCLRDFLQRRKYKINFGDMMSQSIQDGKLIWMAREVFEKGFLPCPSEIGSSSADDLKKQKELYTNEIGKLGKTLVNAVTPPEAVILKAAGLYPRVTPSTMLPLILRKECNPFLKNVIGALGVLWTLEQRANRCSKFIVQGDSMSVALQSETDNPGHENWSPAQRPSWLILEVEMNMMIRRVQVEVAEQMINPPGRKHSVMQLNMGEGKTAVIVPLLVLALADGKQLCRVTVLKSLFRTNLNSLIQTLGGMLNRRVYVFPCRRDMPLDCSVVENMLSIYEECLVKGGVVLTLPEYRLSFQLKGYEMCLANRVRQARSLVYVEQWLTTHVRDVLDESDEILHVKYQLVYTVGGQRSLDGAALRWETAQALLKLVPSRMRDLLNKYGDRFVEIANHPEGVEHPEVFPHCRLLGIGEAYQTLITWLAEDILDGKSQVQLRELSTAEKQLALKLLTKIDIDKNDHNNALELFQENDTHLKRIFILMGYLKYEVLQLSLSKRWKVNYGVNPQGHRRMAIPFRAKDVAAERTEFGHPDVAIMFTQLSYYYSGLSDRQLEECFSILEKHPTPEIEYARWIHEVPKSEVPPSVSTYSGVNLFNYRQKFECLFPILQKNMAVIDFWLSKTVFPKESKVFGRKLVCTAWDLCSDAMHFLVTGFSGTNDSSLLLPSSISQQDLPQLQDTNESVTQTLLLEENNRYEHLESGVTGKQILEKLSWSGIPVLLDSGSLMLELSNEEVAERWLKILPTDSQYDAAVYFDETNLLKIKYRQNLKCSTDLELSSYRERLNRCVVYLDDFHTRGTDLKIPSGTRACVTIGTGMTRDKMVQACMRMRLLGRGHTVCFYASHEAHTGIEALKMSPGNNENTGVLGTKYLLDWVVENSRRFERDGLVHWSAAGLNYAQKRSATHLFDDLTETSYRRLGERCSEKELTDLKPMYGDHRQEQLFLEFLANQILRGQNNLEVPIDSEATKLDQAIELYAENGRSIEHRCKKHIADKKHLAHLLDEEQEKELEQELEEERQVSRPGPAAPAQHSLAEDVMIFIRSGQLRTTGIIVELPYAFNECEMWPLVQPECWGRHIYATMDFMTVVVKSHVEDKNDEFLRPPVWVACVAGKKGTTVLLMLSPFEANELLPLFRSGVCAAKLHMFASRLLPTQNILIKSLELTVPSSPSGDDCITPDLLAPLYLFSGSVYFDNKEEQDAYSSFLGLIPRPRRKAEQYAFDKSWTVNAFVLPKYRHILWPNRTRCKFLKNPGLLVTRIVERRYGYFPVMSHVSRVVVDSRKVFV